MIYYKFKRLEPIYYFCEIDYIHKIEQWLPVVGYKGLYKVSDLGRVKSLKRKKVKEDVIRAQQISKRGYLKLGICGLGQDKNRNVHQLIAEAFLNHKPCGLALIVNHININRLDNRAINLELITVRENTNKKHIKSSSKYVGVSLVKGSGRWRAGITIGSKDKYLGSFSNEYDAHLAYQKALSEI